MAARNTRKTKKPRVKTPKGRPAKSASRLTKPAHLAGPAARLRKPPAKIRTRRRVTLPRHGRLPAALRKITPISPTGVRRPLLKIQWSAQPSIRRLSLTNRETQRLTQVLNRFWWEHAPRAKATRLEVNFVDEKAIRALHDDFLQDPSATDVITFDLGATPDGHRLAAIAVCVPMAKSYAKRHGASLREELHRLVIHGVLHLLNYDDRTAAAKKLMRRREDEILRQVFHQEPGSKTF
jgi:probable rRNA maturation factor